MINVFQGSTCALTEAILRSFEVKTGFFSSPHLIDVNERFQLCGSPITKDKFAKYFWKVYDELDVSKVKYKKKYFGIENTF